MLNVCLNKHKMPLRLEEEVRMVTTEAKAKARNEAAREAMPVVAGPWTLRRCGSCGSVRGMPVGTGICLRCLSRIAKEA